MLGFVRGGGAPGLGEGLQRLLALAVKLTRTPWEAREQDVAELRRLGFSDAAVHDAVAVSAYFNFVNRMALGLGVELEPSPG